MPIVAVKGLGGYHLACDATSTGAVDTLRRRKAAPDKPLAVMVRDLAAARRLAQIDRREAGRSAAGPQRPIVLVRPARRWPARRTVAPGNPHIGLLLPYTPLHHLLFHRVPGSDATVPTALVMTSGNLTDEPICYDDADAAEPAGAHRRRLAGPRPPDPRALRRLGGPAGRRRRTARSGGPGATPRSPSACPSRWPPTWPRVVRLKNTFCLAAGRHAWMSQHIGDMGSLETLDAFERSTRQFADMYEVDPQRMAADAHPGYQHPLLGRGSCDGPGGPRPAPPRPHRRRHGRARPAAGERVIGFAFDGTGYGTDGAIWGGEVLVAGYDGFERSATCATCPLPGGDATIRKPSRAALAHLWAAGIDWAPDLPPVGNTTAEEQTVLRRQLERGVHCVPTSSMGRLFDAVSSLLGVRHTASYEAQAAMELEHLATGCMADDDGADRVPRYRFAPAGDEIDAAPVLRAMVDDMRRGDATGAIAAGFHVAVAELIAEVADRLRDTTGIERVALSGGVFQNVLLLRLARAALAARDLQVLTHRLVPPNDGGLALGQMAVAGWRRDGGTPRVGAA